MGTWGRTLTEFETALRAAGRSPRTIILYRRYLTLLARTHPAGPFTVTLSDLRAIMGRDGWAPETRKSARTAFRRFYHWAHGIGLIESSPAELLETVRVPLTEPRPAPEFIVRLMLSHTDQRLRFMALLAATLGMRAGEIARVHSDDYAARRLVVHGKGGRRRTAFVASDMLDLLLSDVHGWAFEGLPGRPMTPGHVSRLLSRAMPDGWTAHTLRHRAATVGFEATRDIYAVSKMLGHSRVETTQRYVAITDRSVERVYRSTAA